MNQSAPVTDNVNALPPSTPTPANAADVLTSFPSNQSIDRSLIELRSGRRLEKVTASIESFLLNQISRLDKSLDQCKLAVDQNQVLQRVMADFELQKEDWESSRQSEILRLREASEKLIESWQQLENERHKWHAERR